MNKYYFLIILGTITFIFITLIEKESDIFSGEDENKHPIILFLTYSFGLCLSFLLMIFYNIYNKRKNVKIYLINERQKYLSFSSKQTVTKANKFLWILIVSTIDFIFGVIDFWNSAFNKIV